MVYKVRQLIAELSKLDPERYIFIGDENSYSQDNVIDKIVRKSEHVEINDMWHYTLVTRNDNGNQLHR